MNKVLECSAGGDSEAPEMGWLAKTRGAFLEIPNLAILKILVISSSATFTYGIALA
ncbi:unnamed protein product, partial [Brassica oleracea]